MKSSPASLLTSRRLSIVVGVLMMGAGFSIVLDGVVLTPALALYARASRQES